ncbi:hypothetical protein AVEN_67517-1 [Araneus ventricosus]|uniref:Uncharacterized protein n=1 Tax=Araneus ventricosus TaxID=182803 RepID=A0A4Y2ATR9_ARAVE|nr:hypothetical protein AVEN_67517-1 [Araneus ventricosus]
MKDRPPRQHSQALRFLHYSPQCERLMQQPPGKPGRNKTEKVLAHVSPADVTMGIWRGGVRRRGRHLSRRHSLNFRTTPARGLLTHVRFKAHKAHIHDRPSLESGFDPGPF